MHVGQDGVVGLSESISSLGPENPFTALVWPLNGEDPDDAFSRVPYEKVHRLHIPLCFSLTSAFKCSFTRDHPRHIML